MPTSSHLNPFAPPYTPIHPGVTPPHHPPPPFLLPPPPPPSAVAPPQFFTYIPSLAQNAFYCNFPAQTGFRPNPPRQTPPLPAAAAAAVSRGREYKNGGAYRLNCERGNSFQRSVEVSRIGNSENRRKKLGIRHKVVPVREDEQKTTVMIKNIPYDCPRIELINLLDEFCSIENEKVKKEEEVPIYAYDFVYLPIDFRSKRSRGFAFVNFTNPRAVLKFLEAVHLKKWGFAARRHWPKVIEVVSAQIQGKEELVKHFSDSVFECETDEFLPACFSPARDGSGQLIKLTVVGKRLPRRIWSDKNNLG